MGKSLLIASSALLFALTSTPISGQEAHEFWAQEAARLQAKSVKGKRVAKKARYAKRTKSATRSKAKQSRRTVVAKAEAVKPRRGVVTPAVEAVSPAIGKVGAVELLHDAAFEAASTAIQTPFGVPVRTAGAIIAGTMPSSIRTFLQSVQAACGSVKIVSTFRRGARIARSGRPSCHASGQAVDYTLANPSCALRVASAHRYLGHSTDYGRVRHFHVSSCGQEAGIRFAHNSGRRYVKRYKVKARYAYARAYKVKRVKAKQVRVARR